MNDHTGRVPKLQCGSIACLDENHAIKPAQDLDRRVSATRLALSPTATTNRATATTTSTGSYKAQVPNKDGKYRAKAPNLVFGNGADICSGATSPSGKRNH